ncbi:MAG: GNAT family N-acetyltransferase [Ruegeria sp.]|uniref:GNAT family N-acetyltransferase n=1 Tax=Ruegeria sp. TaxID=1879320 RepID=UPI00349EE1B9
MNERLHFFGPRSGETTCIICPGRNNMPHMLDLRITGPHDDDGKALAEIRVEAMRSSLEAIGRFDPVRARERFLASYDPADTQVVFLDDQIVGFYVVRRRSDHLYLDHLYIRPPHQGKGLGRKIVRTVQEEAREAGLPIRLMALKQSSANDFYRSCGFAFVTSDAFDNHYVWNVQ